VYVVDTNIISSAAPGRPAPSALVEWMNAHSDLLFLSVVAIAEIEDGIAKLTRQGAARKSADLASWLETVLHLYGQRILVFDAPVARIAGGIADQARGGGHAPGFADIIIAATARHYEFTILSRNVRHFQPLGVAVLDPFVTLPS
jgi:predicted nucleic acid-binding protein